MSRGTLTPNKVDSMTSMIFTYKGGAQAALTTCFYSAGPVTATVMGTEGRIEIDRSFYNQASFSVYNKQGEEISRYDHKIAGEGRQYQAIHTEKCIAEGLIESPIMSLDESIEIMQVMDDIRAQIGVEYPTE